MKKESYLLDNSFSVNLSNPANKSYLAGYRGEANAIPVEIISIPFIEKIEGHGEYEMVCVRDKRFGDLHKVLNKFVQITEVEYLLRVQREKEENKLFDYLDDWED